MTVNPGFGGQKFIPEMLNKIKSLHQYLEKNNYDHINIEVDGGIDPLNTETVLEAGANILVAGSSVFAKPDIPQAVKDIMSKF